MHGLPGYQRFDSLAVEEGGNICVATLVRGGISVFSPRGELVEFHAAPEGYCTNICFGGEDMAHGVHYFVRLWPAFRGKLAKARSRAIGEARMSAPVAMVHAGILHLFPELVQEHGGDPEHLLRRARIDPAAIGNRGALIEYRSFVRVLRNAAAELSCPDFGLRLAARQDCDKALGPMGVAVSNSQTVGQAIEYCSKHHHAYSLAARTRLEPYRANHQLLRVDILLDGVPDTHQTMEHALMLASQHIAKQTAGAARVREVLFSHEPQSAPQISRSLFGCDVKFGQTVNGIVLADVDLRQPIVQPDARIFEMAAAFIEARFPDMRPPLRASVHGLVFQYLGGEGCTIERVAEQLCLHPRTLQRRLRAEGTSFDDIKDEIRRDLALRHIKEGELSLTCVADKLGYAETSVLTRSCYRWFGATPGELRRKLRSEAATADATWARAAPRNAG